MPKDTPSHHTSAATNSIGGDGWFTLLLSTLLIGLSGGLTLLWQGGVVLRHARNSPATLDSHIEVVMIPGVQLVEGQPNQDFRLRLQRGLELHQHHGSRLLLMGGHTSDNFISEAEAGKDTLTAQGVASEALLLEDGSHNTLENLRNARDQLHHLLLNKVALVSNRYHLARCKALANGLGMAPRLCAAEEHFHVSISSWPRLVLEAYYLHWYHTGKLWSRLTRNRHSLARIS